MVKDSFIQKETASSRQAHGHPDFDFEWVSYVFRAELICSNSKCTESLMLAGDGGVAEEFDGEHGTSLQDSFFPKFCFPMPPIVSLPTKCPPEVKKDLELAFQLFWSSSNSSANAIRFALEKLLDHQGVPRQTASKKGKQVDLTLHRRIDLYAANEPASGKQLMALKWLGNTGSHGNPVNRDDLLDAFEVLEHCLSEVIEQKSKRIAKLAAALTKKHSN